MPGYSGLLMLSSFRERVIRLKLLKYLFEKRGWAMARGSSTEISRVAKVREVLRGTICGYFPIV